MCGSQRATLRSQFSVHLCVSSLPECVYASYLCLVPLDIRKVVESLGIGVMDGHE